MIAQLLSSELTQAFAWTLIHSLWQIALIAVLLSITVRLAKKASAHTKYIMGLVALALTFVVTVVTFAIYYIDLSREVEVFAAFTGELVAYSNDGPKGIAALFIEEYLHVIVNVWLLGSLFFLARYTGGYIYLKRLAADAVNMDGQMQKKLSKLKRKFEIQRDVLIKQSSQITTPMVTGFIKPVILFPIGLINQLSTAEVNAILAHELAHIKRHDFLFNVIQSLAEAIFYYHPGIWFISNAIRRERENSCDDLAILHTEHKFSYAKTLIKLQELKHQQLHPAMAMGGNGQFSQRIKRLIDVPVHNSNLRERLLAVGMILLSLYSFTDKPVEISPDLDEMDVYIIDDCPQKIDDIKFYLDTIPERNNFHIKKHSNHKDLEMEMQDGVIKELIIDGLTIPFAEYQYHQDLINSLTPDNSKEMITVFPDCGEDFGNIYYIDKNRKVFKIDSVLTDFDEKLKSFENFNKDKFGFHVDRFDKVVMDSLLEEIHSKDWSTVTTTEGFKIDSLAELLPTSIPAFLSSYSE